MPNTFYVDPTSGLDANSGASWALAFKTMQKAYSVASNGDTVRVLSGSTQEPLATGGTTGNPVWAKEIAWIADNGLGGQGSVTITSYDTDYIVQLTNTTGIQSFTGFTFDGNAPTIGFAISATLAGNKTFTNCTFKNTTGQLIYSTSSGVFTFTGCTFIQETSTTGNMLYQSAAGGNWTFTNCTLTHTVTGARGLFQISSPVTATVTFTGCTFNNIAPTYNMITLDGAAAVVMTGCTVNKSGDGGGGFYTTSASAVTLTGNTFNMSGTTGNSNVYYAAPAARSTATTFVFSNNTINTTSNHGVISLHRLDVTATIEDNIINQSFAANTRAQIQLQDATLVNIRRNTITDLSTISHNIIDVSPQYPLEFTGGLAYVCDNTINQHSGYGISIKIGEDATSGATYDEKYNSSIVENNTIYGPVYFGEAQVGNHHCILIGHQKYCHVRGNRIEGVAIGCVWKSKAIDTNHIGGVYGNSFKNCFGYGVLVKGPVNLSVNNNTFYNDSTITTSAKAIIIWKDGDAAYVSSTGTYVKNNVFFWQEADQVIYVDDVSLTGIAFTNNLYWNEAGVLTGQKFFYNLAEAVGLAAWKTASSVDADALSTNPLFTSTTDFTPTSSSPLLGAAVKWWAGYPNPIGADGEPFQDMQPDVGGIQSKHGPFHPINL